MAMFYSVGDIVSTFTEKGKIWGTVLSRKKKNGISYYDVFFENGKRCEISEERIYSCRRPY